MNHLKRLGSILFYILCCNVHTSASTDTIALVELIDRAFLLQSTNPDSAMVLSYQVLTESQKNDFKRGESYALLRISNILINQGHQDSAKPLLKRALEIRKNLKLPNEACGEALLLGSAYNQIGLKDSALFYYLESKRLADESNLESLRVSVELELAHFFLSYRGASAASKHFSICP